MRPMTKMAAPAPAAEPEAGSFLADALTGLGQPQKTLPPKYFYDAEGSALFEKITAVPEYYPTRAELSILAERAHEIADLMPPGSALVEFGSGSSQKIRILLPALKGLAAYVPVDLSGEFLRSEAAALQRDFPEVAVRPVIADFTAPFALPPEIRGLARTGFFPGSTIGNFEPDDAAAFLAQAGTILGTDARMIVGVDLVKDKARLEAAYDDAAGVTAAFNLNLLARMNRELGADFDLPAFSHRALYDERLGRIEMHLVSAKPQVVTLAGRRIAFAEGETIHTENSYKYTPDGFRALAARAGWSPAGYWTDTDKLFSVHVLKR